MSPGEQGMGCPGWVGGAFGADLWIVSENRGSMIGEREEVNKINEKWTQSGHTSSTLQPTNNAMTRFEMTIDPDPTTTRTTTSRRPEIVFSSPFNSRH